VLGGKLPWRLLKEWGGGGYGSYALTRIGFEEPAKYFVLMGDSDTVGTDT
jgi:hypothetical protein